MTLPAGCTIGRVRERVSPWLIYALIDPRTGDIRYIGKSCSGLQRARRHHSPSELRIDNSYKGNWIRSLPKWDGHEIRYEIRVLEELPSANGLGLREIWWIAHGREQGWRLTNLTTGGDGQTGRAVSMETREKIAAAQRGRVFSAEHREKMSRAAKRPKPWIAEQLRGGRGRHSRPHSEETKAVLRAKCRGWSHTEKARAAIAAAGRGRQVSEDTRRRMSEAHLQRWAKRRSKGSMIA